MATVEDLARDIAGSMKMSEGAPLIAKWIDNRYRELMYKTPPRSLREVKEVVVPANYTTGTVSIERGSEGVLGVGTDFYNNIPVTYLNNQQQWFLRAASAWYQVDGLFNATVGNIFSAFAEDSVVDSSYTLAKRHISLAPDTRWITSFLHTRLRRQLDFISLDEMNIRYPGRTITGTYPWAVAQVGLDDRGYPMVEVYPSPKEDELLHYIAYKIPAALSFTSTIPQEVEAYVLKEGVLIDVYRWKTAKSVIDGNVDAAALWRNESRSQMTTWERVIKKAIKANRAMDDTSFILQRYGISSNRCASYERTAHDVVCNRWTYP